MENYNECKSDILKRLRRIEGQVKGIQKMVEEEKYCVDILVQIAAIRAAINKVGGLILENHSQKCIKQALGADHSDEAVNELISIMLKFMK